MCKDLSDTQSKNAESVTEFFLFKGNLTSKRLLRSSLASCSSIALAPMRKAPGFSRCPQPPAGDSHLLFQVGQGMQRDVGSRAGVASFTHTAKELGEGSRCGRGQGMHSLHPSPEGRGQRGGLQQHKHHPMSINQTTKSSPGLAVMLMDLLSSSQHGQAACRRVSHILIQKTHRGLKFLLRNPAGPSVD